MAEEKRNEAAEAACEVNLSDVIRVRHEKLAALREAGADPYKITKYPQDTYSADIKERFAALAAEGTSDITETESSERGYYNVVGKFRALGADILTESDEPAQKNTL